MTLIERRTKTAKTWSIFSVVFVAGAGTGNDGNSGKFSDAMLVYELDQLENLVQRQNEMIGDLESRVQDLEQVKQTTEVHYMNNKILKVTKMVTILAKQNPMVTIIMLKN